MTASYLVAAAALLPLLQESDTSPRSRVPGERWEVFTTLADGGFDGDVLGDLDSGFRWTGAAAGMLVHHGGVVHAYGDVTRRYMCHSVRKSLMSALFGIFVEQGAISRESTLAELAIDDRSPALTKDEREARVVDLLRSRSGVYHVAAYEPPEMKSSRPARGSHAPGSHWWNNDWDFNTLLTILEQETGERFFEAFEARLATPIGMEDFRARDGFYHHEPARSIHPAYPLLLSARDLARVGVLMANGGRWGDRAVVPASWVEESTQAHSRIPPWQDFDAYGYMWWLGEVEGERVLSAQGTGGNSLDVFPDIGLVLVLRADTYSGGSVDWARRRQLVRQILRSRVGPPSNEARLVPLATEDPAPPAVALSASFLEELPLDLPRLLPSGVPEDGELDPVRLQLIDGDPVVVTGRPPALVLDLVPTGVDRFWVREVGRRAAIDRDEDGSPRSFVLQGELLARVRSLAEAGDREGAARERARYRELFSTPLGEGPSADEGWIHESLRALVDLQEENGSWPYEGRYRVDGQIPVTYEVGGTAAVGLALLFGNRDGDAAIAAALRRGVEFVLAHLDDPGMLAERVEGYDMRVLGQAYALLLLCHAQRSDLAPDLAPGLEAAIDNLARALVHEQLDDGGWNYQGRPVHASFVTASVVQALLWARAQSAEVPVESLVRAADALARSRFEDGGFRYFGTDRSARERARQDLLPGSIGRSPICETMLHRLGRGSVERVRSVLASFHEHWHELEARRGEPGTHEGPYLVAPYYFYYGHRYAAQAIHLLPEEERPRERARLRTLLLGARDSDSLWNDREFPRSRSFGTAMVVLALLEEEVPLPPAVDAR